MKTVQDVNLLIVGFGFSVIPLCREMDLEGIKYTIISNGNPVWKGLLKNGTLDFDLVSSYHTSFYSFDLVKNKKKDEYPTAKEFYEMHLSYFEQYKSSIIDDTVTSITNFDDHSVVKTTNGRTFCAQKVVVSTGFGRAIHQSLNHFDYNIKDKHIVINSIGDSSNLIMAKLIPGNNKITCLNDGFVCLDKMVEKDGQTFTVDQLENHNVAFLSPKLYRETANAGVAELLLTLASSFKVGKFLYPAVLKFSKVFMPNLLSTAHPEIIRPMKEPLFRRLIEGMPKFNGMIAIKYWPIDTYAKLFGSKLEKSIKDGYLLNDIGYFVHRGLIKLWPKTGTEVDFDNNTIENNGRVESFDYFIKGDREAPRLPEIIIKQVDKEKRYNYKHKNTYFGVVPRNLKNIYFLGYTRPFTGGLANITEMQCLLAAKMIKNNRFNQEVYSNIRHRIKAYNDKYYPNDQHGPIDHLVYYGFYTEEVARAIGIDINLKDCRSIKKLNQYLMFPNNTFKYRQTGEFKVDGCEELVDYIDKNHQRFSGVYCYLGTFISYNLWFVAFYFSLFMANIISLPVFGVLSLLQYVFSIFALIPTQNAQDIFASPYNIARFGLLLAGITSTLVFGPAVFAPLLAADLSFSYLVRKFIPSRARNLFNDLKVKEKYDDFFNNYLKTYRKVKHPMPVKSTTIKMESTKTDKKKEPPELTLSK